MHIICIFSSVHLEISNGAVFYFLTLSFNRYKMQKLSHFSNRACIVRNEILTILMKRANHNSIDFDIFILIQLKTYNNFGNAIFFIHHSMLLQYLQVSSMFIKTNKHFFSLS